MTGRIWITEMEETMSDQISNDTSLTKLSALAEQATASGAWWEADALEKRHVLALAQLACW